MAQMLIRDALRKIVLDQDAKGSVLDHYIRAVTIQLQFDGVRLPWMADGEVMIPGCHVAAYAYARAFGVGVVDGMCTFVSGHKTTRWTRRRVSLVKSTAHSWNVIQVNSTTSVILDIFPDDRFSMGPVLLRHPHPAYWVPKSARFRQELIRQGLGGVEFSSTVDAVVAEFHRIDMNEEKN